MTLTAANNYAHSLHSLRRFDEAKSLLCKTMLVSRRVLGDDDENTLRLRWNYARALYEDGATFDDSNLHEAFTTLEDTVLTAQRVFGRAHPLTKDIALCLIDVYKTLRARETPSPGAA